MASTPPFLRAGRAPLVVALLGAAVLLPTCTTGRSTGPPQLPGDRSTRSSASPPSGLVDTGKGWGAGGLQGPRALPGSCRYATAGDGDVLPDPDCTPGAVDGAVTQADLATTVCRAGYSASVRPPVGLTEPAKIGAMAAYGATGPAAGYEYDHLVPLELGGSSDTRNLWPEPDQGSPAQFDTGDPYGRNAKDGVEDRLGAAVCAGRVPLAAAQAAIARDWTTAEATLGMGP